MEKSFLYIENGAHHAFTDYFNDYFVFDFFIAQKRTLIDDVDQKFDELQELVSIL